MTETQRQPRARHAKLEDLAELKRVHEGLAAEVASQKKEIEAMRESSEDTHKKVSALHAALMEASPGQEKSLLQRMAAVTIGVESGQRAGRIVLWIAGALAVFGITIRFGAPDLGQNR